VGHFVAPRYSIHYHGQLWALYKLWLQGVIFTILSLGWYYSASQTQIRRYIAAHYWVNGQPFAYLGSHCWHIGFLKGLLVLIVVSGPLLILSDALAHYQSLTPEPNWLSYMEIFFLSYLAFILLGLINWPWIAAQQRFKYQINHWRWQHIEFSWMGSMLSYVLLGLGHYLHSLLSLGLSLPIKDQQLLIYRIRHFFIGQHRAQLSTPLDYNLGAHWARWFFIILGLVTLCSVWQRSTPWLIGGVALSLLHFGIAFSYHCTYQAQLWQAIFKQLSIGQLHFVSHFYPLSVVKFKALNLALMIISLGLAYPWVVHRKQHFIAAHLQLVGTLPSKDVPNEREKTNYNSEGLVDFFRYEGGMF